MATCREAVLHKGYTISDESRLDGNPPRDLRWLEEDWMAESMAYDHEEDPLAELQKTQASLRRNIEASEELIARSEELLGRHRAGQAQGTQEQA